MGADEDKILNAFRERFRYDRGLARLKPVADYQRMFRGFDDGIARQFARLDSEAATADDAKPAIEAPSEPPPPDATAPGPRRVGRLLLLSELGRGAQGSVHLAEDTHLHRQVALKLLDDAHAGFGAALDRFRREAEITAKLDHPGIFTIYEAGEDAGVPCIAMRHVEGEPLSTRIETSRAARGLPADSETASSVVRLPPSGDEAAAPPVRPVSPSPVTSPSGAATRSEIRRVCRFIEKTALALHARTSAVSSTAT